MGEMGSGIFFERWLPRKYTAGKTAGGKAGSCPGRAMSWALCILPYSWRTFVFSRQWGRTRFQVDILPDVRMRVRGHTTNRFLHRRRLAAPSFFAVIVVVCRGTVRKGDRCLSAASIFLNNARLGKGWGLGRGNPFVRWPKGFPLPKKTTYLPRASWRLVRAVAWAASGSSGQGWRG